jgi:hypothetical protein
MPSRVTAKRTVIRKVSAPFQIPCCHSSQYSSIQDRTQGNVLSFRHGSNEGNNQEVILAAAEIALFAAREYPNGSCRAGKRARLAVAIVTSALPSFEPCPYSVKNPDKREMPDVPICDDAIASAMAEEQSGTSSVSQLTEFLTEEVKKAKIIAGSERDGLAALLQQRCEVNG